MLDRRHSVHVFSRLGMVLTLTLGLTVALSACGGGDDSSSAPTAGNATKDTVADASPAPSQSCATLPYTVSLRGAKGDTVGVDDESFKVVSAKAVSLAGGAAYTLYMADYEIPDSAISAFTAPTPPAGRTLVTLSITTFNAKGDPSIVKAGDVIPYTPDFNVLTFRVLIQKDKDTFNSSASAMGTLTVKNVGDSICADVEYSDSASEGGAVQNRLKGSIGAAVVKKF
jgi:hypothetical protein